MINDYENSNLKNSDFFDAKAPIDLFSFPEIDWSRYNWERWDAPLDTDHLDPELDIEELPFI